MALRALLFAILLISAACPRDDGSDGGRASPGKTSGAADAPLEVMFFGEQSGQQAKAQLRGAQMGAALVETVRGREVKVTSAGSPSGRALARAAGDRNVIGAITVGGESAISDAAVALGEHSLPVFELRDDLYEAGQLRKSVFQMRTPHSWTSWRLARYFGPGDRAYKKVAILREAMPASDLVAGALTFALQERGVESIDVKVEPRAGRGDQRVSQDHIVQEVEKLAPSKPQAVVLEGSEQFVSESAKVMQDDKWRYRGRSEIEKGWHPHVAGFESLLFTDVVLAEGTVASADYSLALPPSESIARIESFVNGFSERFDSRPRGDELLAYDAVRVLVEAVRRTGKLDRTEVFKTLEAFDRVQFAHTPVSFGPSDHVGAERDVQGLWTVKRDSAGLERFERWTLLMRTFTSDLERTNILEEDWPAFFEGTTPGGEAPFFYQAKSGVVSKKEDQTH